MGGIIIRSWSVEVMQGSFISFLVVRAGRGARGPSQCPGAVDLGGTLAGPQTLEISWNASNVTGRSRTGKFLMLVKQMVKFVP